MSSLAAIDTLDALDDLFDVRILKCSAEWWLRKWYPSGIVEAKGPELTG
jgi:hypothetical protein